MTRPFDPEYDDPTGAGWVISDEYFDDFCEEWEAEESDSE